MRSHLLRSSIALVGLLTVASLGAQTSQGVATSSGNAQSTSTTEGSGARRSRAISPELSAALAAGVKFEAPAPEKKAEEPVVEELDEDTDLRDVDKPKNTIIRLPKYIVEGERPPVFRERDVHTEKGLADLAIRRYLSTVHSSLNKYHLPAMLGGISSETLALEMYREQERLNNMREFDDRVYLYRTTGDEKSASELKRDADSTFIRRSEYIEAPRANGK